jgi:hypothetical protein
MKRTLTASAIVVIVSFLFLSNAIARSSVHSSPRSRSFASFAGKWETHRGLLQIDRLGNGRWQYRTYLQCTSKIVTDCDYWKGNLIYDGGFMTFKLTKVNGNTARGQITNSGYSYEVLTLVVVTLDRLHDSLHLHYVDGFAVPFCGPRAPNGLCGA